MNVTPYLRVSGQGQVEGDGFTRQLETIFDFCKLHGLQMNNGIREAGVSGTVEAMDRPAFSNLMEDISSGKAVAGAIVVERMDRLARDLMVQEFLLAECRKRGIKVFSADQGGLTDMASNEGDPTRVLIRQVLGALAQWEKAVLVAKMAAARNRIKATGEQCEGNKPFGYYPGEMTRAKLIVQLVESGISYHGVARMLAEEGFTTRRGKPFSVAGVSDIYHKFKGQFMLSCLNSDIDKREGV